MISVVALVVCAAVVAAGIGVSHMLTAAPAANATANPNCTLIVPASPLTAQGLATPYQFTATNPADGPCNEADGNQTAFVQGAILDNATGTISIYNPLVIDEGTQPAVAPVVPRLPAHAVVALWFGYNGSTLTLAGADQAVTTPTAVPSTASSSSVPVAPSASSSASVSPSAAASAASASASSVTPGTAGTPTASAGSPTQTAPASPAPTAKASVQSEGSAPLSPDSGAAAGWFDASLTRIGGSVPGHHDTSPSPSQSPTAAATTTAPPTTAPPTTAPPTTAPPTTAPPSMSATAIPPASQGDSPAASPAQDAILTGANCVAGENFAGRFSAFSQVGACNSIAFFAAANSAIRAGRLRVPSPGTAADGKACPTTRSFTVIDQDQSDNVTTEYLTTPNGQIAQDTAASRNSLTGTSVLFNGSDNGLIDLFVDPALGCRPWETRNLGDNGAPTPSLPLDELQAAAWAGRQGGGPAAIVPLNDPMTLDSSGQFSTDKTDTYRSLVDMKPLPAGESPGAYCSDMEQIQGTRLQQDYNLLAKGPSPVPGAADNLFEFLAMRLQQSFMNLNCSAYGQSNDVSITVDGNGVVTAACFVHQARAVTPGPGNPMAGTANCPATTAGPPPTPSASQPAGYGSPKPTGMSPSKVKNYYHHHHHG